VKAAFVAWTLIVFLAASHAPRAQAQTATGTAAVEQAPASKVAPTDATAGQPAAAPRVTSYTLPPDRDKKARALSKVRLRLTVVNLVYGIAVLLLALWWKLAPKFRDLAERVSSRRFLQALVFAPLIALALDLLSLPTGIYENWVERVYGLSVQGWASWFWDWTKGELISVISTIIVVWILYAVIRSSPRRWWFYFWLVSLPLIVFLIFLQPLVIDPMFHKFEPLQHKDPALTAELEKMVRHAGQDIPPERMFWMGAGEKTTELNAYVTGFGASKRIVVWDTTIAKMSTPQIVFVAGHEMGHYVLHHIVKGLAFLALFLLITFFVSFRLIGWLLARWGPQWAIRGLDDLASFTLITTIAGPILNTFSRYLEHQADQYGLEVTHGLTPDSGEIAAQAFNILGDVDLGDPDPSPLRIFLFYNHPAVSDRIQFSLHYDPWSKGESPEFVK
jgi:Zn-dependent protease with chaperone function